MLATSLCLALSLAAPDDRGEFVPIDYGRIERRLAKEPTYVGEPRYALFLWGPAATLRTWAVLDRSDPGLAYRDVLYLDLDGDGDLTEDGERFTGTWDAKRAGAGMGLTIDVGDIRVPGTKIVHEDFRVSTVRKAGRSGIAFMLSWRGEESISGGYGRSGANLTEWGASPADAPVLRPTALGPLSFSLWGSEEVELPIGGSAHLNVIIGNRGSGPDTLCVLDEDFLDLEKEALFVTIVATDAEGEEVRERSRILGHC